MPGDDTYIALIISGFVMALVGMGFIITIIRQQKKIRQLYIAKASAEIKTIEKERMRIAANLHDQLAPMLSVVKIIFSTIETNPKDKENALRASNIIDDTIRAIREICNDLTPNLLATRGCVRAVENFIKNIPENSPTKIDFSASNVPDLPADMAINVYRIILEIIQNTLKHAKATKLGIHITSINQYLIVKTEDNGIGFDTGKINKTSPGLGLLNLLSRTEVMGGNMLMASKPATGTKYLIKIPLK